MANFPFGLLPYSLFKWPFMNNPAAGKTSIWIALREKNRGEKDHERIFLRRGARVDCFARTTHALVSGNMAKSKKGGSYVASNDRSIIQIHGDSFTAPA